jgi:hypothetical protein
MAPLAPLVPAPLHFLKAIFDFFEPLFFKNWKLMGSQFSVFTDFFRQVPLGKKGRLIWAHNLLFSFLRRPFFRGG